MLRRHRADLNQQALINDLRRAGVSVRSVSVVDGFVDLVAGYRSVNYLLEVKSEKGKLRDSQKEFMDGWKGKIIVVRKVEDFFSQIDI